MINNLGDIVYYRIPCQKSVSLNGEFIKVNSILDVTGFFVSDFEKKNIFVFKEKKNNNKLKFYSSKEKIKDQTRQEYLNTGKYFLSKIIDKGINKAILSRIKIINQSIDILQFYKELCIEYKDAFVYLISSKFFGTWIGASPELLINYKNNEGRTMSLAGTLPNNINQEWSTKEFVEQDIVTQFINKQLSSLGLDKIKQSELETFFMGPVKHLKTNFNFFLPQNRILELVSLLHPTPAVSGFPRNESIKLIKKVEKHKRQFYSGLIGLHNRQNSDIFVNLRCAQVFDQFIVLYLGGGYTKSSIIINEWDETEFKANTLLNVINNIKG
ncbi:MAG: hypothetical protein CL844_02990 [Crocinitomicaceae bacterium]|nr:hypothetical protein [Crocinitomicaceae bacterium]